MVDYPYFTIFLGMALMFVAATLAGGFAAGAGRGFPLPPAERRIGCVDGLRGYLALSVLAHHFIVWLQMDRFLGGWKVPPFNFFNQMGAGGVALFFMITGLVFYPRVLTGWRDCRWLSIYVNRFFRLIPLIVVSVALVTLVVLFRTGNGFDSDYPLAALQWITAYDQPPLLGYSSAWKVNAAVLWSLKVEWIFYLAILPCCALAMDAARKLAWPSWIVPVGLFCFGGVLWFAKHYTAAGQSWPRTVDYLPTAIPCFAVGMIAFECQRFPGLARLLGGRTASVAALAGLLFAMFSFSVPYNFALPFFGFFFVCVACGNDFFGILRTRGALVLGECSYGIYLMHGIALSLLYVELHDLTARLSTEILPLLIPVAALVVVPFAALAYLRVERPSIRFGARIARRWRSVEGRGHVL